MRGVDPTTGHFFDDTRRYIDALDLVRGAQAADLRAQYAARLSAARRTAQEEAAVSAFRADDGWLSPHAAPRKPVFRRRRARWTRTAMCSVPAKPFRMRESASTPPRMRRRKNSSHCETSSGSIATSSCREPVMAPTTARWPMRCAPQGRARGVATVKRDVTDARLTRAARCGRTRGALQLRQTPRRRHAHRRVARDRAPHRAARLARGRVFRSAGPPGPRRLPRLAADEGHRRSHGPPRCSEIRSTVRSSRSSCVS